VTPLDKDRSDFGRNLTRRHFLGRTASGLGAVALAHLLNRDVLHAATSVGATPAETGLPDLPHFAPKAKRVIYLFQSGGPSHLDLYDYKPVLAKMAGTELPPSIRLGQRQSGQTITQQQLPIQPSGFKFDQHGQSGAWISEVLPYTAKIVDDLCFIKSMHTDHINHDPALTFSQTGFHLAGRPSLGAWVSYGLGTENEELPAFVVMQSGAALYDRLWGSGFLPSNYSAVKLGSVGDRVLYVKDPKGFERQDRRHFIDDLDKLNQRNFEEFNDPEILTRIAQYEMAFRMQASVPDLIDISNEPASTFDLYGEDAKQPGTFASNCLLARRLMERGVRFVQIYLGDWDTHDNLPKRFLELGKKVDQGSAALVQDLKQRGLLDETLVIWGGEFGRTVYSQGKARYAGDYGRDHHGGAFTMWMAGGGVKPGIYGESDEFGYRITKDPVSFYDLNATIMHQLGIDHTRLTYKYQGRNFRLTDVGGKVLREILA
jgi:hypothetical protein